MADFHLQPFFDDAPASWSVALAVVTLAGFVLWGAGGRLARAGVALGGFFVGGLLATSAAAALEPGGSWVIGIGVTGALAGTLLAFLLFRVWVGLLGGLILGAVVPAVLLLWGVNPPDVPGEAGSGAAAVEPLRIEPGASSFGIFDGDREATGDAESADRTLEDAVSDTVRGAAVEHAREVGLRVSAALGDFFETASAAWKAQLDALKASWSGLADGQKHTAMLGAAGGFLVGFLLGLALPNPAAALQTALVGAFLLCGGTLLLLQRHAGLFRGAAEPATDASPVAAASAPAGVDPRVLLLTVALVTLVGLLLQWTLASRRSDAKSG